MEKKPASTGRKEASSSSASRGTRTYTDPKLRDELKDKIMAADKGGAPGQWSARKAQLLASEYKKAGGSYVTGKPNEQQQHLNEWTQQDWQTSDGKPAEREGGTTRYLPKKAWVELTPAEKKATNEKKKAGSRAGKQHVDNTKSAREARKKASED